MSLLKLLEQKQIRSTMQIAEAMGTTREMIEAQLERYAQLGIVKKTVTGGDSCGENCKTCKGCSGMKKQNEVIYWEKIEW